MAVRGVGGLDECTLRIDRTSRTMRLDGQDTRRNGTEENESYAGEDGHQWLIRQQTGQPASRSRVTPPKAHSRSRPWP